MCGICGILSKGKKKSLKNLLLNIEHRGKDATGVAYFNPLLNGFSINKCGVKASEFVKIVEQEELENSSIVIGHTRAATKGSPLNTLNNHPLKSKDTGLILIHNGVIESSFKETDRNKERDGEVDSFEILMEIDKRLLNGSSLVDAIKSACSESITGAYACCVIDPKTPNKVYLFKHTNPIFLGIEEDCLKFASTKVATECFWTHEMEDGDLFVIETPSLKIERHLFSPKKKPHTYYHYDNMYYDNSFWVINEKDELKSWNRSFEIQEYSKRNEEIKKIILETINEDILFQEDRLICVETERKYMAGEVLKSYSFENKGGEAVVVENGKAEIYSLGRTREKENFLRRKLMSYL